MGYIYMGAKISKKRLLVSTQATLKKIKIPKTVSQGGLPSLFFCKNLGLFAYVFVPNIRTVFYVLANPFCVPIA